MPEVMHIQTGRARRSAVTETVGRSLTYGICRQGGMTAGETHQAIEAIFRIERASLIAGLAPVVRHVGLAEELHGLRVRALDGPSSHVIWHGAGGTYV